MTLSQMATMKYIKLIKKILIVHINYLYFYLVSK
jgi:hypothetical protein